MPAVEVVSSIDVPLNEAWPALLDIETYPEYMENVRSARILEEHPDGTRISAWSVWLDDANLEWTEFDRIDARRHVVEFHQLEGDLRALRGQWTASERGDATVIRLTTEFEIGIPLLEEMLNPIAGRALRDNLDQMLRGIERRILSRS